MNIDLKCLEYIATIFIIINVLFSLRKKYKLL